MSSTENEESPNELKLVAKWLSLFKWKVKSIESLFHSLLEGSEKQSCLNKVTNYILITLTSKSRPFRIFIGD